MNKEIVVTISPKGQTQIEVNHAKGEECVGLIAPLNAKLGVELEAKDKPERHQIGTSVAQTAQIKLG